ncbi:fimbrial protein [Aeromonas salmonicida]|uniref:fimbrial protein n=1 Tax=Aeromonas salmonicida TaxID=645 RepID=UPI0027967EB1|nr:fimbrial protein [Aeromonas salmonicida]MDQ1884168.1 fimbrial protein [Aeromonas salmonicida]
MKKTILAVAMCFACVTPFANAHDGQVNFNGRIIENGCEVVTKSLDVNLGQISKEALAGGKGTTTSATRFDLVLKSCPVSVSKASVIFDGERAIAGEDNVLKLTQGEGVAEGVGIQLRDSNQQVLPLHQSSISMPLVADADNKLGFTAQYIALGDNVTAGEANGVANFTIQYN